MSRSQQEAVSKQAQANSRQDQANAQTAFGSAAGGIADFSNFINSTYGQGGEFQKDSTTMANDVSQAGTKATEDAIARNAQRTGENTAGNATTIAEAKRAASRDLTSFNAAQDQKRLTDLTAGKGAIPGMWSSLYGPSISGSGQQISTANDAAKAPGFMDWFMQQAQQGAATGAKIAAA